MWTGVPYGPDDFHGPDVCHTSDMNIHNYKDPKEVRYCRLNSLKDLKHEKQYVEVSEFPRNENKVS